jgi:hypothetical protein
MQEIMFLAWYTTLLYTPILTAYIGRKMGKENIPWRPSEQIRLLIRVQEIGLWSELNWLAKESTGGLWWTWQWTFWSHEVYVSQPAQRILVLQVWFFSVQLNFSIIRTLYYIMLVTLRNDSFRWPTNKKTYEVFTPSKFCFNLRRRAQMCKLN